MTTIAKTRTSTVASRTVAPKHTSAKPTTKAKAFGRDEMSVGTGRAHRSAAKQTIGAGVASGQDFEKAFDAKVAALKREVVNGVPGASDELAAVLRDRSGVQSAVADLEQKIATNDDPATWANVKPQSVAKAEQADLRGQLARQLSDLKAFGVKVAQMTPSQRQDLQNFFALAKNDPAAFKRFVDANASPPATAPATQGPAPVAQTAATGAPANIQAAIDFGLTQLGAPYVGGASPFRFGTPGNGQTYQLPGQRAFVSPKGVIGYDCSGLMVTMLKKAGIDLSRFPSSRLMKANLPEVPKDQLQPGDLLVKDGHVAMYIGDGKMIESVPAGVRVRSATPYLTDPAYTGRRPA